MLLLAIGSVVLVSLVSLVGVAGLGLRPERLRRILIYLVSFSAGALLGDVFFHLFPEIADRGFGIGIAVAVLVGITFSFVIEKFVHWHHCHDPEKHHDAPHPVGYLNLVGSGVHNFVDGVIIGASYLVSVPVGVTTTLAIVLHEIPRELGDFGILVHAGFPVRRALWYNFLTALVAIAGTLLALAFLGSGAWTVWLVAFAAGTFIYIASADLIPELHKETRARTSALQFVWFLLGMGLMAALLPLGA